MELGNREKLRNSFHIITYSFENAHDNQWEGQQISANLPWLRRSVVYSKASAGTEENEKN